MSSSLCVLNFCSVLHVIRKLIGTLRSCCILQRAGALCIYCTCTIYGVHASYSRSQRPRGLRRRSAAAPLLRAWVRIPPGALMFFCCECCVLSGRGLCDELITRPEESYRLWCVAVCDLETSGMSRPWPNEGCRTKNKHASYMLEYTVAQLVEALR